MSGPRRLRLLAFAVLGSLCLTAARAEAAWKVVFRDDGRAQWQQLFTLVGAACNRVEREGAGLRVKSCPVAAKGDGMAMVWARKPITGNIKMEFDFVHYAAEPKRDGTIRGLMLLVRGDGQSGFSADPTKWGAQCCAVPNGSTGYGPHARGLQLNFAYRHDPRGNETMRLRGLKASADGYGLLAESAPQFLTEPGRSYRITAIRTGSRLKVDVKDQVTGTTQSFTTTNPYIGSLSSGWIGFRQMHGRDERIANVKIAVDD